MMAYNTEEMTNGYPEIIKKLLALDAPRFSLLKDYLANIAEISMLSLRTVEVRGKRHLFLRPQKDTPAQTLCIAHYDRTPDTPGANDNTAAVLQLAEAARRLGPHGNWCMIFSDGEEAASSEGAYGQGAYDLARALKQESEEWEKERRIFIFDATGCGEDIIISDTLDRLLKERGAERENSEREVLTKLRQSALEASSAVTGLEAFIAPTPFSDDLGFLAAGLFAQTITLLPRKEREKLMASQRYGGENLRALLVQEKKSPVSQIAKTTPADTARSASTKRSATTTRPVATGPASTGQSIWRPQTWERFHSKADTLETLSPRSFERMVSFMVALISAS